jgi:uncharacterized protein (TIGR00299 family) protein
MSRKNRTLFIDASAGASGDMILGALVDLGVPMSHLRQALNSLPIDGWTLRSRKITRCGIAGRKVDVRVEQDQTGRGWRAIKRILESAELQPAVRERSLTIFRRLFEAEARAHGLPFEKVHLHEAGAADAIIDIVGACVGLEKLAPGRIIVSPMTTGFGTIRCAHGDYPVPGPATLLLVRGAPVSAGVIEAERLTPTGAAVLTGIADDWGNLPPMRPISVGYGAGDRELGETPNMLRMVVGAVDLPLSGPAGKVVVIECTVDDSTPQALAHACERLLDAGALDVFTTAVTMKKGRAGHHLTVMSRPDRQEELVKLIFEETTTIGLRFRVQERLELERSVRRIKTPFGQVAVKVAELDGETVQAWPEYEDCANLARRRGVSLRRVQLAALRSVRGGSRGKVK